MIGPWPTTAAEWSRPREAVKTKIIELSWIKVCFEIKMNYRIVSKIKRNEQDQENLMGLKHVMVFESSFWY